MRASTIWLLAGMALSVMVLAGAGCMEADDTPLPSPAPEFIPEAIGYDTHVIYRYVPQSETPATYLVTYEITRNETTVTARTNEQYENVSDENPIEFLVERNPGDSTAITIEISTPGGKVAHTSSTGNVPVTPTPLATA
jgi:hypothetical protein